MSSDDDDKRYDELPKGQHYKTKPKKLGAEDDSSEFEDVTDSEDEKHMKPVNKRNAPEDTRNRVYLQHYRETVEQEQ